MTDNASFKAAIARKPPDHTTPDSEIGRLKRAATRFLKTYDKPSKAKKFIDRMRKERSMRQNARMYRIK
jgi:hypothetical protein